MNLLEPVSKDFFKLNIFWKWEARSTQSLDGNYQSNDGGESLTEGSLGHDDPRE